MEPARVCLKRILRRGIKRGQLPSSLDLDTCMALLLGPGLYGHIFHRAEPRDFGRKAAETFWRAHGVGNVGLSISGSQAEKQAKR